MNPHLEESACLYVLDQLEPAERAAFERQRRADPDLAALVRELEAALDRRIRSLPASPLPPALLARLERQLDQEPAARRSDLGRVILRWGVAAAVLLAVGLAGFWKGRASAPPGSYMLFAGLGAQESTLTRVAVPAAAGPDARFVVLANLAQRYWDRPGDQPVKDGRAYAVFDPGTNQGFIAVRQLAAAPAGKRYHVWVIDAATGQAREAGALPAAGGGLYFFSVAPAAGTPPDRVNFSVTAEDAAAEALPAPTGRAVLGSATF